MGHPISFHCLTRIGREAHDVTKNIKEAMFICVSNPSHQQNPRKLSTSAHLGWGPTRHLIIPSKMTQSHYCPSMGFITTAPDGTLGGTFLFHNISIYGPTPWGANSHQFPPFLELFFSTGASMISMYIGKYTIFPQT